MNSEKTPVSRVIYDQQALVDELVENQRYGVEYQPILKTSSQEIIGYEALARFYTADNQLIPPLHIFELLHQNIPLLRKVEHDLKKVQIDYAPADYELFINIDPHAIEISDGIQNSPMLSLLCEHPNLVVELIENTDLHDANAALSLHDDLREKDIQTALDDIGAEHAMLSLEILSLVNFLKFDLSWLYKLKVHRYAFLFQSMITYARTSNKPSILEGIENEDMYLLAKKFKLDRIQGFYYRDLFQSFKP